MGLARKLLTEAGTNSIEELESRRLLAGDLGIYDIACDAKFTWLVPGDKFNVVVDLFNDSDEAAVGKVYVDITAVSNTGNETLSLGYKSVSFNLGPVTQDGNGDSVYKKTKVSVPVTLGFDFETGNYTFAAAVFPGVDANDNPTYEDYNTSNDSMSTIESSRQQEYVWEFAYRVGTYDSRDLFDNDPRIYSRKNVKMMGSVYEELTDDDGYTVDANEDGEPDYVYKKVSASLTGIGWAEGFFDDSASQVTFNETNATSVFSATVSGGKIGYRGYNQFDVQDTEIEVLGALKSFRAPGFNFEGCSLAFDGNLGDFVCNNLVSTGVFVGNDDQEVQFGSFAANSTNDSSLVVPAVASPGGNTSGGTKVTVRNGLTESYMSFLGGRIASLSVGDWDGGFIRADTIGTIDSRSDLICDIQTDGTNREAIDFSSGALSDVVPNLSRVSLTRMNVKNFAAGLWDFDGGVGSITIGKVSAQDDGTGEISGRLFITIAGRLGSFTTTGIVFPAFDGDPDAAVLELFAFSMNSVTFNADVTDSVIKSGVAFPYAGIPWFPANGVVTGRDVREAGVINSFTVKGNITDTVVRAGFNPEMGDVYSDDFMKSDIKRITIGGTMSGSTEFLAKSVPSTLRAKVVVAEGQSGVIKTLRRFRTTDDPDGGGFFPADPYEFEYNSNGVPWLRTTVNGY